MRFRFLLPIVFLIAATALAACDEVGDEAVTPVQICRGHGGVASIASGYWDGSNLRQLPTTCRDGFAGIAAQ